MADVLVLQHHPCETPGLVEEALTGCGLTARVVRSWEGDEVPRRMQGYAGLVVLGGPMSVYEQARYPWMADELHLIDRAVKDEAPLLGICLGSQMLATVLGGQVRRGEQPEIGWHEVRLAELAAADDVWGAAGVDRFTAFHWHGDIYDVPPGAEPLASSAMTACQAFVHGRRAYGVLFHMEVTRRTVADMVSAFDDEVRAAGLDGAAILEDAGAHLHDLQHVGRPVLQSWAALALG